MLRELLRQLLRCLCSHVGRMIGGNRYGAGTGNIWLDNVQCLGNEGDLGECWHNGWGIHDCTHYEDVSISCDNESSTTSISRPTSTMSSSSFISTLSTSTTPRNGIQLIIIINNNNNNNNTNANVYGAVIRAEPLREFTQFI